VNVWLDLSNSPHPLIFAPVVARLEEIGHRVSITCRDTAQTLELTLERWPDATVIGGVTPRSRPAKAGAIAGRIRDLRRWARRRSFDLALSHNSYAQIVAARTLGIAAVTAMDFEHQQANHIAFRAATRILLPEALPLDAVRRQGARAAKVVRYRGLKEELVFADFEPDANIVSALGVELDAGGSLVVSRAPNPRASYLRTGEVALFDDALRTLGAQPHVHVVVLTRHDEQRGGLEALGLQNLVVPRRAVDSRSLMYRADLVLGGGGTMTREAALLGVPTLTAYPGAPPAVDRWLEREGLLARLTSADQLRDLRPRAQEPRSLDELHERGRALARVFVDLAVAAAPVR
jgi:uncharacterized protein